MASKLMLNPWVYGARSRRRNAPLTIAVHGHRYTRRGALSRYGLEGGNKMWRRHGIKYHGWGSHAATCTTPRRRRYNQSTWIPAFRNGRGRYWIKGAIKRPGALRRKLARGYVAGRTLRDGERIPETLLEQAYRIARRRGDTQTMRQINLARRLKGFRRAHRARRAYRKVAN